MSNLIIQQETRSGSALATHRVLRNTYALLAMTLLFSAVTAGTALALKLPYPGMGLTMIGYFGLLFLTVKTRDSGWGVLSVFGLTGFLGYTLGPILAHYLALPNGGQIVATAFGATGLAFVGLSAYALTTKRDLTFMGGFLFVGVWVAFVMGIVAIVFQMPALSLAVAGAFALLSCGLILFQTQNIVNGGETNYIMATVSLYVSLYNLLVSLLQLLGVGSSD
jgi:modulator of FtsH protease